MNILITGKDGFIAKELIDYFERDGGHNVVALNRYDLPLLDSEKVDQWFEWNVGKIDVVIHTATTGGSRLNKDGVGVFFNNIAMFHNILRNVRRYNMLLFNLTSGAEEFQHESMDNPYGASKSAITSIINTYEKDIINLKIWNCFGKYGLPTRFIEGNIEKYINGKDIVIFEDREFDFFYSEDLYKIICYFIGEYKNFSVDTETVNCVYSKNQKLTGVAKIINNLEDKKVNVDLRCNKIGEKYCASFPLSVEGKFKFIGLIEGIKRVYKYRKCKCLI